MRKTLQFAVGVAALGVIAMFFLVTSSVGSLAATTDLKAPISSLAFFMGDWECAGKFDSSGKAIEAHQHFAPDLGGNWITFRHDDKPPFAYHALAEWGWDSAEKKFVMTIQDSAGGVRLFRSDGWESSQFRWEGGAVGSGSTQNQRFSFERLDDRHFKVSYLTLKDGSWSRMDSSVCSKQ